MEMTFMTLVFSYVMVLFIIMIHMRTGSTKYLAIVWGLILSVLLIFGYDQGLFYSIMGGLSGFLIAWMVFLLANHFEESIFIRLLVLFISIKPMLLLPMLMAEIIEKSF